MMLPDTPSQPAHFNPRAAANHSSTCHAITLQSSRIGSPRLVTTAALSGKVPLQTQPRGTPGPWICCCGLGAGPPRDCAVTPLLYRSSREREREQRAAPRVQLCGCRTESCPSGESENSRPGPRVERLAQVHQARHRQQQQDGLAVQERGDDPLPALPPERGGLRLRLRARGARARPVPRRKSDYCLNLYMQRIKAVSCTLLGPFI